MSRFGIYFVAVVVLGLSLPWLKGSFAERWLLVVVVVMYLGAARLLAERFGNDGRWKRPVRPKD